MTIISETAIPGFVVGNWTIDPVHRCFLHRQAHDGQQGSGPLPDILGHARDPRGHPPVRGDRELTLHGVTKPVSLAVEMNGLGPDAYGGYRAGFTATTVINRNDFGIAIRMPMDGGGGIVGDKINIILEVEAVLDQPEA